MRYWNGFQWRDHHELQPKIAGFDLSDVPKDDPYPDGVVFLGDECTHCHARVRYWNDSNGTVGNASCECCVEGPETCEPVRPSHELPPEIPPSAQEFWDG